MNVIAEYHIDADSFLLGHTLDAVPGMDVVVEQHTADERGFPILFFWASGDDHDRFSAALDEDPTVESAAVLDEAEDHRLYRVQFAEPSFYPRYRDAAAKILELRGSDRQWHLRMRFPDQESFREYTAYYDEVDATYQLNRLQHDAGTAVEHRFGLTHLQHETLMLAHERGYFDQPRRISLDELAEVLDVSPQAVAGRLRRAHANLIENTLGRDDDVPIGLDEVYKSR